MEGMAIDTDAARGGKVARIEVTESKREAKRNTEVDRKSYKRL